MGCMMTSGFVSFLENESWGPSSKPCVFIDWAYLFERDVDVCDTIKSMQATLRLAHCTRALDRLLAVIRRSVRLYLSCKLEDNRI